MSTTETKLSLHQVEAFLADHTGQKVSNVAPIGKGEWSQAFSFRNANRDYIARFGAHKEDFAKDQIAAKFASPNLPIPRMLEIGQAFNGYFAISDRAFGEMFDDVDAAQMRQLIPAMLRMLDAIRETELGASTGYGAWDAHEIAPYKSWREFLLHRENDTPTSRTHGWRANMATFPVGDTLFNEAFGHLKSLVSACPEDRYLLHTDLLHYNVLVSENRISAVIDWGNAMYGDFLYDLATFTFWSSWYPAMGDIDWAAEARSHYKEIGFHVPHFAERLRCYELHTGLGGMAYQAFKKDWANFETTMKRMRQILS